MASRFAAKRQDDLNRFYTRPAIGDLLVDLLGDFAPASVIDFGVGEGSLSKAVVRRWPEVAAVTVDIDTSIVPALRETLSKVGGRIHRHHVEDVFDPLLPDKLSEHGRFDLAVCNPPFYRPEWKHDFAHILRRAGLANACASSADVRAEILFLAQNLRVLRSGGKLALIVPDGLVTGWRWAAFRSALLSRHGVDCAVQLPAHSFQDTEARCFVLVLTKEAGPTRDVALRRYDVTSGLSDVIHIGVTDAEQRLDYDYYLKRSGSSAGSTTLRSLGADVRRGSIDTVQRRNGSFQTFHTTDFRNVVDGRLALDSTTPCQDARMVRAAPGDILMARVDRSLHLKVAMMVGSGSVVLTDCVYRVRVNPTYREAVFKALRSPEGAASLLSITKGVSARLLGKADLLDLPLCLSV